MGNIDAFPVNVTPSSHMLFTRHRDMPGIIGKLGSMLGEHNVNIASMQVGRKIVRGDAVMVLGIDDPVPAALLEELTAIDGTELKLEGRKTKTKGKKKKEIKREIGR